MAVPPGRCPDCPGPEPGGGGGESPAVPHLGIAVDEGDVLPGALRLMRELRPGWEPARVKTKVRPAAGVGGSLRGAPRGPAAAAPSEPTLGGRRVHPRGAVGLTPRCYRAHPEAAIELTLGGLQGPPEGDCRTHRGGP